MSNEKNVKYELTTCIVEVNEAESITSYGVKCLKGTRVIAEIPDISPNKPAVEKLVDMMNEEGLPPSHFPDVIEDIIDDLI